MNRRALAISLITVLGPSSAWSKSKPPEVVYPTTRDQQSLEDLFKQPIPSDQPTQAEPTPAPTALPPVQAESKPESQVEKPHPVAAATPTQNEEKGTAKVTY